MVEHCRIGWEHHNRLYLGSNGTSFKRYGRIVRVESDIDISIPSMIEFLPVFFSRPPDRSIFTIPLPIFWVYVERVRSRKTIAGMLTKIFSYPLLFCSLWRNKIRIDGWLTIHWHFVRALVVIISKFIDIPVDSSRVTIRHYCNL